MTGEFAKGGTFTVPKDYEFILVASQDCCYFFDISKSDKVDIKVEKLDVDKLRKAIERFLRKESA